MHLWETVNRCPKYGVTPKRPCMLWKYERNSITVGKMEGIKAKSSPKPPTPNLPDAEAGSIALFRKKSRNESHVIESSRCPRVTPGHF